MKIASTILLPLLAALSTLLRSVHAHDYVSKFTVDGKSYQDNVPGGKTSDFPIRQISSINPVKGASNSNMKFGTNAKNAALVADANPGSTISFLWGVPDGSKWPHNTGPLMTYVASCGRTTYDKFDASKAQWFKIAEAGRKDSSTWFQQDIMNGKPYMTHIPNDLASGQYPIRHEIIALHLATSEGAEFYPSCTQVNVGGSKTGIPPKSALVSFPGAYKDTDPGIFDMNVFNLGATYAFPGPSVVKLGLSSSSSGSSSVSSSISSGKTKPTDPASPSPSPPSGNSRNGTSSCGSSSSKRRRFVKREEPIDHDPSEQALRSKHMSRVFRKLGHISEW